MQEAKKPDGQSSLSKMKKKQRPVKKPLKSPSSAARSFEKQPKLESKETVISLGAMKEDGHKSTTLKNKPKKNPAPKSPDNVSSQNIKAAKSQAIPADPKGLQPKDVIEEDMKDKDGNLSTPIKLPDDSDNLADVGISPESETRTSVTPQTGKRRKRKRRRSHSEDHTEGTNIDTLASETLQESMPSSSKQNASANPTSATKTKKNTEAKRKTENPTTATKTNDSINRTVGKKKKRTAEDDEMKQDLKKLKSTPSSVSPSGERTEDNAPEPELNAAAKTDSHDGKKTRRRKKKPKSHENSNETKPSIEQNEKPQNDSPAAIFQPKLSPQNKTKGVDINFSQIKKNLKKQLSKGGVGSQTQSNVNLIKNVQESKPASKVSSLSNKNQKPANGKSNQQTSKSAAEGTPKTNRTRNKNRNRRKTKRKEQEKTVSDARLKAYGINPKKHGFRMKFLREQEAKKQQKQNTNA